jgi:hypothetical protein
LNASALLRVLLLLGQLLWAVVCTMVGFMGKKERGVRTAQFWGSHQRFFRWGYGVAQQPRQQLHVVNSCAMLWVIWCLHS